MVSSYGYSNRRKEDFSPKKLVDFHICETFHFRKRGQDLLSHSFKMLFLWVNQRIHGAYTHMEQTLLAKGLNLECLLCPNKQMNAKIHLSISTVAALHASFV